MLAEYVTGSGRVIGYIIMDKRGKISTVKREDLLKMCEDTKAKGVAFIQNGIYRVQNGVPQIACYVGEGFPKIEQTASKPLPKAPPAAHIAETKKILQDAGNAKSNTKALDKYDNWAMSFTNEQALRRLRAHKEGVDPYLVGSPKQSPEQMDALIDAKKAGFNAEYVADPAFSIEKIKFLTQRLRDKRIFAECQSFLYPEYSVEQLNELIAGVEQIGDVGEMADENLTPEEMYVRRKKLYSALYRPVCAALTPDVTDEDVEEFAKSR